MGAGLRFGDGGDSSQDSATTTSNTTTTQDNRIVADGGSVVVGAGGSANVTTTTTDLGAVQRAADLGEQAIVGATSLATEANANAGKLAASAIGEIKTAYENATQQAQSVASGNKTLAIIGMIVAGLFGVAMLQQKAKA